VTIAERFASYRQKRARLDVLRRQVRDLENDMKADKAFVLDWFLKRQTKARYLGVMFSRTFRRQIDPDKARELLGADAKKAEKEVPVDTLTLDREWLTQHGEGPGAQQLKPLERTG
jgi:hypothetical protein